MEDNSIQKVVAKAYRNVKEIRCLTFKMKEISVLPLMREPNLIYIIFVIHFKFNFFHFSSFLPLHVILTSVSSCQHFENIITLRTYSFSSHVARSYYFKG